MNKSLNSQQLEAIHHGTGPLLIIAGAGTGKTTVITERIRHLVESKAADTDEILALTFTEKAATEMETRVDQLLPLGYTQMWILTFHSFCDRILRAEGLHVGLPTDYELLTGVNSLAFFKKHFFDFDISYFRPLGNPYKFIEAILHHFSRLKDEDITHSQYLAWAQDKEEKDKELAQLYSDYESLKIKEGKLDFSDLISWTLHLFRSRPGVLKKYQKQFKYVLVDEYQDTNFSQNVLVNLLVEDQKNITVVADDDQAIYRWRGAAISNVIQFRKTYPDSHLVTLTDNYRSTQIILDHAHTLIQFNNPDRLEVTENIDKRLVSSRKEMGEEIEHLHFSHSESEADGVVKKIQELLNPITLGKAGNSNLSPRDIAILVRANSHAEPFIKSLQAAGIPHQFLGPSKLMGRPEIKDLIALLHVLDNIGDDTSFFRVLSMPIFSLDTRSIADLSAKAKKENLSLFEGAESDIKFSRVTDLISKYLPLVVDGSAGQIIYTFLQDTGLLKKIINYESKEEEQQALNIVKFFNKIKSSGGDLRDTLDWLDLLSRTGDSPQAAEVDWSEVNAVNILTIHSAKGLEFPVVFLVSLVSGRFPSITRSEALPVPEDLVKEILPTGDHHLQEERRLFYVGTTRAKDKLFLTHADYYGDAKRQRKPSPFITETLGEHDHLTIQPSSHRTLTTHPHPNPTTHHTQPTPLNYLSYSQIQTFLDCPLHYKAKYLLHLPTPPTAASTFGNVIHLTLKQYFEQFKAGEHPNIIELLDKHWLSTGYENKKHESLYRAKGERFMNDFVTNQFDPHHLPLKLEEPFIVPLDGLKIGGKIDRVDPLPGGRIEVIDYKTTTKPLTQKEADANLQLSFYALAATMLPNAPFAKKPEDVVLSLYYFETGEKVTTTRTSEQLEAAKLQIHDYARQISESDFQCNRSFYCQDCDFFELCN